MPLISPSAIQEWNKHDNNEIEAIFEFSFHFFYNDAHNFLFVLESKNIRCNVQTFASTYALISLEIGGAST